MACGKALYAIMIYTIPITGSIVIPILVWKRELEQYLDIPFHRLLQFLKVMTIAKLRWVVFVSDLRIGNQL